VDQNPAMAGTEETAAAAAARARGAALLVLASIVSVQCGSALATSLFDSIGPAGAVFLRAGFGALVLLALTRAQPLRAAEWRHRDVLLLGAAVAAVNFFFYAALERLPLGITVTLEFVGPLGVAVFGSRRRGTCSGRCWPPPASSSSPTGAAARESIRSGWSWRSPPGFSGRPTSSRAPGSARSARASGERRWRR
jgi:hypothetical protein